jgi:arginine exporter protein ArgO
MDFSAFLGGLSVLLSLIVAIGAQNAFVCGRVCAASTSWRWC